MKIYTYNGEEFISLSALKRGMGNVSLPADPSDEALEALGVTVYEYDNSPEPLTLAELKVQKLQELADSRYQEETSGYSFNGIIIATDRETVSILTGAVVKTMFNPEYVLQWKALTGWIVLDAKAIVAIADAVSGHVQACFEKEARLSTEVEAATSAEELAKIGWFE